MVTNPNQVFSETILLSSALLDILLQPLLDCVPLEIINERDVLSPYQDDNKAVAFATQAQEAKVRFSTNCLTYILYIKYFSLIIYHLLKLICSVTLSIGVAFNWAWLP